MIYLLVWIKIEHKLRDLCINILDGRKCLDVETLVSSLRFSDGRTKIGGLTCPFMSIDSYTFRTHWAQYTIKTRLRLHTGYIRGENVKSQPPIQLQTSCNNQLTSFTCHFFTSHKLPGLPKYNCYCEHPNKKNVHRNRTHIDGILILHWWHSRLADDKLNCYWFLHQILYWKYTFTIQHTHKKFA